MRKIKLLTITLFLIVGAVPMQTSADAPTSDIGAVLNMSNVELDRLGIAIKAITSSTHRRDPVCDGGYSLGCDYDVYSPGEWCNGYDGNDYVICQCEFEPGYSSGIWICYTEGGGN